MFTVTTHEFRIYHYSSTPRMGHLIFLIFMTHLSKQMALHTRHQKVCTVSVQAMLDLGGRPMVYKRVHPPP